MTCMYQCRICTNSKNNRTFTVQEMMFGLGDSFEYFECAKCGCLQIGEIPGDLSRYYPDDYYSFTVPGVNPVKRFLKRRWIGYALGEGGLVGWTMIRLRGAPAYAGWIGKIRANPDHAILDIGCGQGHLLLDLQNLGFSNLTGVDSHIEKDIQYGEHVRVLKRPLSELEGQFDLVMLHHSFEHMIEQAGTLKEVWRLLKPGKLALLRIPLSGSYAWQTYGVNWSQLDAPRHLFLHTVESISLLAGQAGFRIVETVYDSTSFQLWGSEQYRRGVPLTDARSFLKGSSLFSRTELKEFEAKARELNGQSAGDQACFYLLKPG